MSDDVYVLIFSTDSSPKSINRSISVNPSVKINKPFLGTRDKMVGIAVLKVVYGELGGRFCFFYIDSYIYKLYVYMNVNIINIFKHILHYSN